MGSSSQEEHVRRCPPRPLVIAGLVTLAVIVVGGLWLIIGVAGNHKGEVSAAEASALRDQGALFLDVRSPDEWKAAHVPGSTLIPITELKQRIDEVPRDREVVVVCSSGIRSRAGRDILTGAGFTKVTHLAGGLLEWKAQGYSMVSEP